MALLRSRITRENSLNLVAYRSIPADRHKHLCLSAGLFLAELQLLILQELLMPGTSNAPLYAKGCVVRNRLFVPHYASLEVQE